MARRTTQHLLHVHSRFSTVCMFDPARQFFPKLYASYLLGFFFSIILEMLNILAANIYSTLLCSESQGMKLCIEVQCIFHSAGCDSAALFHMLYGQCDFPCMQAVWHGNFPSFEWRFL